MSLNVVFNTWVFLGFLLTKSRLNSKSHVATLLTEIRSKDYLIVCDVKCPIKCFDVFLVIFLSFEPQRRVYSVFDRHFAVYALLIARVCQLCEIRCSSLELL